MNTTVTVVLPEWMVYGLALIMVLQGLQYLAVIYVKWLERKLLKQKRATGGLEK